MKKSLLFFFLLVFTSLHSQHLSIEFEVGIDGKFDVSGGEEAVFDIERVIGIKTNSLFTTIENVKIFGGLSYLNTSVPNHKNGTFNIFSGLIKAEGDFFTPLFKRQKFKITLFLEGKTGMGHYVNNDYDDVFISFGLDPGVKIKYKNFYSCFYSGNVISVQEPGKAQKNNYKQSYLGVSVGMNIK